MKHRESVLFNWVGRDQCAYPVFPRKEDRAVMVDRLVVTLERGVYLSKPIEDDDIGCRDDERNKVKLEFPEKSYRACFTEVPLRECFQHARRFGGVGIGVSRSWLLSMQAAPVHYVRNRADDTVARLHWRLEKKLKDLETELGCAPDGRSKAGELLKGAMRDHRFVRSFLKGMSRNEKISRMGEGDDFEFLEEIEWRMVWVRSMTGYREYESDDAKAGHYALPWKKKEGGKAKRKKRKFFASSKRFLNMLNGDGDFAPEDSDHLRAPIAREELRVIVLPDRKTLDYALSLPRFRCAAGLVKEHKNLKKNIRKPGGIGNEKREQRQPHLITLDQTSSYEMHDFL